MNARRHIILTLVVGWLFIAAANAQSQLVPFRDQKQGTWGYKSADGRDAISPRYIGAGEFRSGRAPVKDADGFAIIDESARIVERIATDRVSATAIPVPPPGAACAWKGPTPLFSTGLQCYVRQLRIATPFIGGDIAINPNRGESFRAALIQKFSNGVVVVEDIGYEGFIRRVLLPGVAAEQAHQWRLRIYRGVPSKEGCGETWSTGTIEGGSFIEQSGGC